VKALHDISKIDPLVRWGNPELSNDPYFAHVSKHLAEYKAVEGESKKAKNQRLKIAESYLQGLKSL
jgi:hypothetical protein